MKTKLIVLMVCMGICLYTKAQVNIQVKVNSIAVLNNQDCDAGGADNSDFVFEFKAQDNSPSAFSNNTPVAGSIGMCNYAVVNEQNGPYSFSPSSPGSAVFFPSNGLFFDRSYNCKNEVPTSLTLTWRAYENDDSSTPSTTPIANGDISPQVISYTVSTANGTYTTQFTQTSSDGACPQTYVVEFEIHKTVGSFDPLTILMIDGTTICTGSSNGEAESAVVGGSGTVLYDWSIDGLGDFDDNATESGLSAGTYTLVVKDALNCRDTGYVTITSIDPPQNITSFSVSSPTVCTNQTGVAYAVASQSNTNYAWSYSSAGASISSASNAVTIDFSNTAMSGTLSVYALNSCSATPAITMAVTVYSSPNVSISGNNTMCDNAQEILTASGASSYAWSTGANTASTVISPTVATVYSVTATNSNGCSSTKAYTVNVIPSPTLQVNGSTLAVCPNQTVALSATGSGNLFIWSDGFIGASHVVNASSTTIYTITNTASNSCFAQVSYTLNVNPGPVLSITGNTIVCDGNQVELTAGGADTYVWSNGITSSTNTFVPMASTSLTLVGTALNGCKDSIIQLIKVVNTPTVMVTGNDSICEGTFATLTATANGTVTYAWNNGANTPTISVSPSGTFTYVVTADNGACTGTTSHELAVKLTPAIDFTIASPIMCSTDPIFTFTANPSGGVYSGTGVTGDTFDPSIGTGIYPVTYQVTASNGCLASQSQTISVNVCTGLSDIDNNAILKAFPNPVVSDLTFKSDKEIKDVLMYDYAGKLVMITEVDTFETTIQMDNLAKGFYTFTVTFSDHSQRTVKVVKE
ncbi:MAG: T9SS type A sorting domain-containing protein [Bacteroidetes bacterium]|nr:T9SS type A sorting domain-containing protein [Bacteroidota bacterium]